jgi:hypothetical protein
MANWMRKGTMLVAAAGLVGVTFGAPSKAEARGYDAHGAVGMHHGFRPWVRDLRPDDRRARRDADGAPRPARARPFGRSGRQGARGQVGG